MKTIITCLALVVGGLLPCVTSAASWSANGTWKHNSGTLTDADTGWAIYVWRTGTNLTLSGVAKDASATHPELDLRALASFKVDGTVCALTKIGGFSFSKHPNAKGVRPAKLAKVILPETVTEIEGLAFSGITTLTHINLSGVKKLGQSAFRGCGLEGVADLRGLSVVSDGSFANASKLAGVQLDGSRLTQIGAGAFSGCTNLTGNLVLPELTTLGAQAFRTTKITGIEIPKIVKIGEFTFCDCTELQHVVLSPEITEISRRAFWMCRKIENDLNLPRVKTLGESAFRGAGMPGISLPGMASVDGGMFMGCRHLARVEIPRVTRLGKHAFDSCVSLQTLKLPYCLTNAATTFYSRAFIEPVYIHVKSPLAWEMEEGLYRPHAIQSQPLMMTYGGDALANDVLWYYDDRDTPDNSLAETLTLVAAPQASGEVEIPDELEIFVNFNEDKRVAREVTALAAGAFRNNANLTAVKIPKTITRIGLEAFPKGCKLSLEDKNENLENLLTQLKAEYGSENVTTHEGKSWWQFW